MQRERKLPAALYQLSKNSKSKRIGNAINKCETCINFLDTEKEKYPVVKINFETDVRLADKLVMDGMEFDKAIKKVWFEDEKQIKCPKFIKQ